MELANGYEQERNRSTQQQRFEQQAQLLGQEDVMASDEEYLFAMGWGMPPLSGFGLGVDRWVQIATNRPHIRDVVLFPM
jgi:lysyl-tRNA synthetase class 2